jgi:hypothetical protein
MTIPVADTHALVQGLVSVVNNGDLLQGYTTEEQLSVLRFLWTKELNAKDIHKEMFLVYVGKCWSRKAANSWVADVSLKTKRLKRKWLR